MLSCEVDVEEVLYQVILM